MTFISVAMGLREIIIRRAFFFKKSNKCTLSPLLTLVTKVNYAVGSVQQTPKQKVLDATWSRKMSLKSRITGL